MIAARFEQIAREDPHALAVICGDTHLSYPQLIQEAARVRGILAQKGTRPGDVVASSLPIGVEAVTSFAACAQMGAVFLPVNPAWTGDELAGLVAKVAPAVVIAPSQLVERWVDVGVSRAKIVCADPGVWEDADSRGDAIESPITEWPHAHPAIGLATSGSTGPPKIVFRSHGGVLDNASAVAQACGIGPGHSLLATVPVYHGGGLASNLMLPLLTGARLILLERFTPADAAELIEKHAIDYLITSPVVIGLLTDAGISSTALRSLKVCLCGGAPLSRAVTQAWNRLSRAPVRQHYGSAEAGTNTMQPHFDDDAEADPECVGLPIPGTTIRILSGDQEQPTGVTGEIAVRSYGLVSGFDDTRLWNGHLRTGDLGWVDESGKLYLAGRLRPWINIGGVKVDPVEVDRVLRLMPGVRDCSVESERGPSDRDVIAATIAPEPGVVLQRADVIRHCREHLAEVKIPRVIRFVEAFATELTGKRAKSRT